MSRDEATLLDLAKAARLIQEFTRDTDQPTFFNDAKTQSAVLHQLMIVGEAVKRLSQEFRDNNSQLPWTLIA